MFIARFLSQWLRSEFDEARDVAAVASRSLASVFKTREIRRKAVRHYLGNVLEKLCKDLCAPESAFGDSSLESKEDIRDRHARVLTTSMRCIVSVLDTLSSSSAGDSGSSGDGGGSGKQASPKK